MLSNYFKIAVRNLCRTKVFSFVNMIGLASSLLIFLFVTHKKSNAPFYKDKYCTYPVEKDFVNDDSTTLSAATAPPALAPAMQKELPEIASVTWVSPGRGDNLLTGYLNRKIIKEKLYGKKVLDQVNIIMITEYAAKRFFGNVNPINKVIQVENRDDMRVSGVLKNFLSQISF